MVRMPRYGMRSRHTGTVVQHSDIARKGTGQIRLLPLFPKCREEEEAAASDARSTPARSTQQQQSEEGAARGGGVAGGGPKQKQTDTDTDRTETRVKRNVQCNP